MELRELKKEVQELRDVKETIDKFQQVWIQPLKNKNNSHLPFVKGIDSEIQVELNDKLSRLHAQLEDIKTSQMLNEKLKHYARYLIEMKLTTFNGDENKSKMITNSLLNDDFMNIKQAITEIKHFDQSVQNISAQYHEINQLLQKNLSLEESLFFMELPHLRYLNHLLKITEKQKTIIQDVVKNFVSLAKETRDKKNR